MENVEVGKEGGDGGGGGNGRKEGKSVRIRREAEAGKEEGVEKGEERRGGCWAEQGSLYEIARLSVNMIGLQDGRW